MGTSFWFITRPAGNEAVRVVDNRLAVLADCKFVSFLYGQDRDKEQTDVVVYPLFINTMMTAFWTRSREFGYPNCPGLNTSDKEKHSCFPVRLVVVQIQLLISRIACALSKTETRANH
jgi:hypothetical protein